ncbi:hypothetical protein DM02DRAFT_731963 [Periconia macrospinosa]|uniref:MYND-type domain-containing protein n=1 Tax=Periconia macrospinosa TaxID=97972 RepID=A0A2V1DAV9_9PLEO|nr:hypothetical protein DM02DRAFT_731963 [Periconia macrospinosa]
MATVVPLPNFRLPSAPSEPPYLDGQPLSILDTSNTALTPATLIATILYNWHPNALAALLDFDAWVSVTWTFEHPSQNDATKGKKSTIEIGRIRNQVTFGRLDESGEKWVEMYVYDIEEGEEGSEEEESEVGNEGADSQATESNYIQRSSSKSTIRGGGKWHPKPRESILPSTSSTATITAESLTSASITFLLPLTTSPQPIWLAAPKSLHKFSVEYAFFAPSVPTSTSLEVDDGDGILMNPHWLYSSIDLGRCDGCNHAESEEKKLNRCGRCGTAAYCSAACQKKDWAVHKFVCGAGLEERGRMLKLSDRGGLRGWAIRHFTSLFGNILLNLFYYIFFG